MHVTASSLVLLSSVLTAFSTPTPTGSPTTAPTDCLLESGVKYCNGYRSCSDSTVCAEEIICEGTFCLRDSLVSTKVLRIRGMHSGQTSEGYSEDHVMENLECFGNYGIMIQNPSMRLARENYFYGDHCGIHSLLHTAGLPNVYTEIAGYNSLQFATLTCSAGSTCEVICVDCVDITFVVEPNAEFSLHCKYPGSCDGDTNVKYSGKSICLTGESDNVAINSPARRLSAVNRNQFDVNQRSLSSERKSKLCTGKGECSDTEFVDYAFVGCDGFQSCENSILRNTEYMRCSGSTTCTNTVAELEKFLITGYNAAIGMRIEFSNEGKITGPFSTSNALIRATGIHPELTVRGHEALKDSLYMCSATSCTLNCFFGACKDLVFDCSAVGADSICEMNCAQEDCSEENVAIIPSCAAIDDGKVTCRKNNYCVWSNDLCVSKQTICSETSEDACLLNKKFCRWTSDGKCELKQKHMPKLYKKFGLVGEF